MTTAITRENFILPLADKLADTEHFDGAQSAKEYLNAHHEMWKTFYGVSHSARDIMEMDFPYIARVQVSEMVEWIIKGNDPPPAEIDTVLGLINEVNKGVSV